MNVEDIIRSLVTYIGANYSTTPVRWPDVALETGSLDEWIAVDVLATPRPRQRAGEGIYHLSFQVAVFAKRGATLGRAHVIEAAVRAVLDQATIDVVDYDAGATVVGRLRIEEGQGRDLGDDAARAELHHLVLTYDARAFAT